MKNVFYVRMVEIRPLDRSEMKKTNPELEGAYVDCIVPAINSDEAMNRARVVLEEDGYEVLNPKEIVDFRECELEDEETAITYKALAWDAIVDDKEGYGEFHCW